MRYGLIAAALMLLLAGCQPANYTSDDKKALTEAHAHEAKEWFSENMPAAKVKSAEVYADGVDILSIIEGSYEDGGRTYHYAYDYHNREMYVDRYYEETMQALLELTAERIQTDMSRIRYNPLYLCIETAVEKTSEEGDTIKIAAYDKYVPVRDSYDEYAREILCEGRNEQVSLIVSVYTDMIPDYDRGLFKDLKGLHNLIYMRPLEIPTGDMIYRAEYRPDRAIYCHAVMEKAAEDLLVGYCYKVEDSFAEDGRVLSHTDEIEGEDPAITCSSEEGKVLITIPAGQARPLVLAKKEKEYRGQTKSTGDRFFVWKEVDKLKDEGCYDEACDYYMDGFIIRKNGLTPYTYRSFGEEAGTYSFYRE